MAIHGKDAINQYITKNFYFSSEYSFCIYYFKMKLCMHRPMYSLKVYSI